MKRRELKTHVANRDGFAAHLPFELFEMSESASRTFSKIIQGDPFGDHGEVQKLLRQVWHALRPLAARCERYELDEWVTMIRPLLAEAQGLAAVDEVDDADEQQEEVADYWNACEQYFLRLAKVGVRPSPAESVPALWPDLYEAYETTIYGADPEGDGSTRLEFQLDRENPRFTLLLEDHPEPISEWALLTASNPRSEFLTDAENEAANRTLEKLAKPYRYWRAYGRDANDGHRESSLLVQNISASDAIWLARRFEQVAIVTGIVGEQEPELVLCGPRPLHPTQRA